MKFLLWKDLNMTNKTNTWAGEEQSQVDYSLKCCVCWADGLHGTTLHTDLALFKDKDLLVYCLWY